MQQAGYHHANMLASQLRVDIGNQQTKMLSMVHQLVTGQPPAFEEEEQVQMRTLPSKGIFSYKCYRSCRQCKPYKMEMLRVEEIKIVTGVAIVIARHPTMHPFHKQTNSNIVGPTKRVITKRGGATEKYRGIGTRLQRQTGWEDPMHSASQWTRQMKNDWGETELVKNKLNVTLQNIQCLPLTSSVVSPPTNNKSPIIIAKGDSTASSHYWRVQDKEVLENIKNCLGLSVLLPNN